MPSSSRARRRSSRQKRSCCVQSNWSTLRCGRNEHSMPAPQTNCLNGSERGCVDRATPASCRQAVAAVVSGVEVGRAFTDSMRETSPWRARWLVQGTTLWILYQAPVGRRGRVPATRGRRCRRPRPLATGSRSVHGPRADRVAPGLSGRRTASAGYRRSASRRGAGRGVGSLF